MAFTLVRRATYNFKSELEQLRNNFDNNVFPTVLPINISSFMRGNSGYIYYNDSNYGGNLYRRTEKGIYLKGNVYFDPGGTVSSVYSLYEHLFLFFYSGDFIDIMGEYNQLNIAEIEEKLGINWSDVVFIYHTHPALTFNIILTNVGNYNEEIIINKLKEKHINKSLINNEPLGENQDFFNLMGNLNSQNIYGTLSLLNKNTGGVDVKWAIGCVTHDIGLPSRTDLTLPMSDMLMGVVGGRFATLYRTDKVSNIIYDLQELLKVGTDFIDKHDDFVSELPSYSEILTYSEYTRDNEGNSYRIALDSFYYDTISYTIMGGEREMNFNIYGDEIFTGKDSGFYDSEDENSIYKMEPSFPETGVVYKRDNKGRIIIESYQFT